MKNIFTLAVFLIPAVSLAQFRFSIGQDLALMRNFSPDQKFWSLGATVHANFHFNKKETGYAWINYYIPGRFKNRFRATAKSANTSPAFMDFTAAAGWRSNEFSLGWKHYWKGQFDSESSWCLYSITGLGLMFTKVENVFTPEVDTSLYTTPLLSGNSQFYRLTLDLGAGVEWPLGGNFFLYSDVRTWVPASHYPSPYLHNNKNVPLPILLCAGLRILFGY